MKNRFLKLLVISLSFFNLSFSNYNSDFDDNSNVENEDRELGQKIPWSDWASSDIKFKNNFCNLKLSRSDDGNTNDHIGSYVSDMYQETNIFSQDNRAGSAQNAQDAQNIQENFSNSNNFSNPSYGQQASVPYPSNFSQQAYAPYPSNLSYEQQAYYPYYNYGVPVDNGGWQLVNLIRNFLKGPFGRANSLEYKNFFDQAKIDNINREQIIAALGYIKANGSMSFIEAIKLEILFLYGRQDFDSKIINLYIRATVSPYTKDLKAAILKAIECKHNAIAIALIGFARASLFEDNKHESTLGEILEKAFKQKNRNLAVPILGFDFDFENYKEQSNLSLINEKDFLKFAGFNNKNIDISLVGKILANAINLQDLRSVKLIINYLVTQIDDKTDNLRINRRKKGIKKKAKIEIEENKETYVQKRQRLWDLALIRAICDDKLEVVKLLVSMPWADISVRKDILYERESGLVQFSPTAWAINKAHLDIIKTLFERSELKGLTQYVSKEDTYSFYKFFTCSQNVERIDRIQKKYNTELDEEMFRLVQLRFKILMAAIESKDSNVFNYILDKFNSFFGPYLYNIYLSSNMEKEEALNLSIIKGEKLLKMLLNMRSKEWGSLLIYALNNNLFNIAAYLIQNNVDLSPVDKYGYDAYAIAASKGLDIVNKILVPKDLNQIETDLPENNLVNNLDLTNNIAQNNRDLFNQNIPVNNAPNYFESGKYTQTIISQETEEHAIANPESEDLLNQNIIANLENLETNRFNRFFGSSPDSANYLEQFDQLEQLQLGQPGQLGQLDQIEQLEQKDQFDQLEQLRLDQLEQFGQLGQLGQLDKADQLDQLEQLSSLKNYEAKNNNYNIYEPTQYSVETDWVNSILDFK